VLELGGSSVSAIANKAEVNRVGCYHTLDKLVKLGVIDSLTKNNIKHFVVESPEVLVAQHEERLRKARRLLPELLSITNSLAYKPRIQYYEGLTGLKRILEGTLSATDEVLGYTNLEAVPRVFRKDYLEEHARKMLAKNVKTRMLSPYSEAALQYLDIHYPAGFDHRLVEVLFVNPEEFIFEYEIRIYDTKVAILSLNPKELIGLLIESPAYAKTQRSVFNLAWLGATSFVAH
jgi:hypothetical protein